MEYSVYNLAGRTNVCHDSLVDTFPREKHIQRQKFWAENQGAGGMECLALSLFTKGNMCLEVMTEKNSALVDFSLWGQLSEKQKSRFGVSPPLVILFQHLNWIGSFLCWFLPLILPKPLSLPISLPWTTKLYPDPAKVPEFWTLLGRSE